MDTITRYRLEWDNKYVSIWFLDEYGRGEELIFTHAEFQKIADLFYLTSRDIWEEKNN